MSNEAGRALRTTSVWLWCARVAWVLLPVSAGGTIADALAGWSTGPARVATTLAWAAWALGLVALLSPRPWGLTVLRVVAPAAIAASVASIGGASAASVTLAISSSGVACGFALSAPVSAAAANSIAYGDEQRFPLRVPASLFLGPLPLAVALVIAGTTLGPLLLADGHIVAGVAAAVIGFPLAFALTRSLHGLARRWLVLVPAGVVIVDPLTLIDPVLMRREWIVGMKRTAGRTPPPGALDLRLGALGGSVEIGLTEPQPFARRKGRRDAEMREAAIALVASVDADALLDLAGTRRIATT